MRVRKHKYLRRTLTFYKSYFDFLSPYKIVLDGTFCKAALDSKVNIREQLAAYLEDEITVYSTTCARKECELFGPVLAGPLQLLLRFEEFPCEHDPPITAVKCLLSLTKQRNSNKVILATQDPDLLEKARERIGVPIIVLSHSSVHLEKPSSKTRRAAGHELDKKLHPADYQLDGLIALKRDVLGIADTPKYTKKKKKGRNPLSCKPKTKMAATTNNHSHSSQRKRRKKRYRMKISEHIKEPLRILLESMKRQSMYS